jgi:hypothetical protein
VIEHNPLNDDTGLPQSDSNLIGGSGGAVDGFPMSTLRKGYASGKFLNEGGEGATDPDELYLLPEMKLLERSTGSGWFDED